MKLSTRLLLPLLGATVVVMLAYGAWALWQREATLLSEAERETQAYATALGVALERALPAGPGEDVAEMVRRVGLEPAIYGVLVYDARGNLLHLSAPLEARARAPDSVVEEVLASGVPRTVTREIDELPVVSVVRRLAGDDGAVAGVVEVVQPLTSMVAERRLIRQRFVLNIVTLAGALTLMVTWLVRRHVSRPLERFVEATETLGRGDLQYRLDPDLAAGELKSVALALNGMADRLEAAREELVREAEERVALERRLRASEVMAETGTLAAGLAHEIGAPLHVIRGRAGLVLKQARGTPEVERNLRIVVEQIDRISHIVRNLLRYTQLRDPERRRVPLDEVAAGVVEFLEDEAARMTCALTLDYPGHPVPVLGDRDLLHQLALNLLLNALHAVEEAEPPRRVRCRLTVDESAPGGASAVMDVDDTGPGIPPDLKDRIFDPFFTTKGGHQGTGLGLAVARRIAVDHGGSLQLVEPPRDPDGTGWSTRLRVVLPLSSDWNTSHA